MVNAFFVAPEKIISPSVRVLPVTPFIRYNTLCATNQALKEEGISGVCLPDPTGCFSHCLDLVPSPSVGRWLRGRNGWTGSIPQSARFYSLSL